MGATGIPRIDRYFALSLYLLLVTGFAMLVSTGKLDGLSVLVVSVALVLRGYLLLKNRSATIPENWANYLTLAYVVFYAVDYFLLSASFVTATVHLVLFGMVVKIFSVRRDRDNVYLAVLAFLEVLAASILTVDTLFLAAFSVFLFIAVVTFMFFEMKRSAYWASVWARENASARRLGGSISRTGVVMVMAMLVLATGLFFVLPRVSGGYLGNYGSQNPLSSGFSESVRLGQIGEIQLMNTVVMHVQFEDGQAQPDMLLRGVALATFDGQRWSITDHERAVLAAEGREFPVARLYPPWEKTRVGPIQLLRYRVLMEPMGGSIFFLAPKTQSLSGAYRLLAVDSGGAVYNNDPSRSINSYEAVSNIGVPDASLLRTATDAFPEKVSLNYLQLPSLDPRISELARQVTATGQSRYDKAVLLEHYLRTNYAYSLNLGTVRPADPLAFFLFERKQGHCEYFASAMTVMLRTLGIPARVVNGFRGGEFNDLTGSYILRARNAHSWVEVFFPGSGWISFDPTAADPGAVPAAASRIALYLDAIREFWREWIINYDFLHQRTLGISAAVRSRHLAEDLHFWWRRHYEALLAQARRMESTTHRAPLRSGAVGFFAVALLALLLNARRILRAMKILRLSRHPERAPQSAASLWYARMTHTLARRGWPKQPAHTAEEFAATIADPSVRQSVALFTEHYQRARFGHSAPDASQLPELYEKIRAGEA